MTSRMLARKIGELMLSRKAHDVTILDLRKLSSAADLFVLCSADSDTQVKAIADAVRDGMEERGEAPWHSEGFQALSWVVVDFVDVVAHVFHRESRSFYNLERLWHDAPRIELRDEEPSPAQRPAAKARVKKTATARPRTGRKRSASSQE